MVPLRLLRPLTTTGLMLALVSCQTNISQGMRVYPLSRTQPHDGLAVVMDHATLHWGAQVGAV